MQLVPLRKGEELDQAHRLPEPPTILFDDSDPTDTPKPPSNQTRTTSVSMPPEPRHACAKNRWCANPFVPSRKARKGLPYRYTASTLSENAGAGKTSGF
jgi:hypothetical protein